MAVLIAGPAFAKQEFLVKIKPGVTLEDVEAKFGAENVEDIQFNNWVKVSVAERGQAAFHEQIAPMALLVEKNIVLKIALHRPGQAEREGEDMGGFIGGGFIGGGGDGGGGGEDGGGFIGGGLIGGGGEDGGGFIGGIGDIIGGIGGGGGGGGTANDPDFPTSFPVGSGSDPEYGKQWGMSDIGVVDAWKSANTTGASDMIIAVIDTGVDYTHEDLAANIWRNSGETGKDSQGRDKATNGVDDDGNGFIDDVVGWDFAKNDNKPYDTTGGNPFFGGNPGHGTHCAGNVGAVADNGKGILGIAPNAKIMVMRFLTEQGQGDLAGAVKSIKYAVDNGAKVLSNSWGSEGDPGSEGTPLKEAIQYALDRGVLFVAAAGNSGYNNDSGAKSAFPASFDFDNIVSVAAIDKSNKLGSFSNYGARTVDIAAPGVGTYSTIPGNKYQNLDGTSMAAPHVAGAAGLYWSKNPKATWKDVKNALLSSSTTLSSLNGKVSSGGKLNVKNLMTK